jgi:integrase
MLEERNVRKGFLPDEAYIRLAVATANEQTARLRPWLRAMFEAAWCYGWRESEVTNLKVRQFDPSAGIVLLEPGKQKTTFHGRRHRWTRQFTN